MAERRDVSVTVEDDEPHRISLELEEDEDDEPFVMETEELRDRMDKSHMPEVRPFEPHEDTVWASRDAEREEEGRETSSPVGDTARRVHDTDTETDGGEGPDRDDIREKAFRRVADKLREKGRSEAWIEDHEDAIWDRVDEILED